MALLADSQEEVNLRLGIEHAVTAASFRFANLLLYTVVPCAVRVRQYGTVEGDKDIIQSHSGPLDKPF
ncbi:hypothetical protein NAD41_000921 [Salmonella enterica]|nr:hypothetical protein [Salmonella enterica]EKK6596304.1 hypothetical protein [Salmonella enterica]